MSISTTAADLIQQHLQLTEQASPDSGRLQAFRSEARQWFTKVGLPAKSNELWTYTSLKQFQTKSFDISTAADQQLLSDFIAGAKSEENHNIVFVDGQYRAEFSDTQLKEHGISIQMLSDVIRTNSDEVEAILRSYPLEARDGFFALNRATTEAGVVVSIDKKTRMEKPVRLLHICATNGTVDTPSHTITVGNGSSAEFIQEFRTVGVDTASVHIPVITFDVAEQARVHVTNYLATAPSSYVFAYLLLKQKADSVFKSFTLTTGGALSRMEAWALLQGTGCDCYLDGLYALNGKRVSDMVTFVEHTEPHCQSNQLFKGIIDNEAVGTFNGEIYVHPQAQQTNAYQSSRAILLSDKARAHAKPQLEIFADDVKCSHGATVGSLNAEELFYLMSRGLSYGMAMQLLLQGFAEDSLRNFTSAKTYNEIVHRIVLYLTVQNSAMKAEK